MRVRALIGGLLAATGAALLPAPASGAVGFEARTSRVPGQIADVVAADLDGDGKEDLAVTYRRGEGPSAQTFVAVFFRGAPGFGPTPDLAFAAPRGAAIFDVGPLDEEPGAELVYLTDTGVWAHGFRGRNPSPVRKILPVLSLVAEPELGDLPAWDFVRAPAPGMETTVIVPGRRSLRLFRPGASGLEPACRVDVEQRSYYAVSGSRSRGRRGGASGSYAFGVTTTIPHLELVEATGDDRLDLVTHVDDLLAVHPGTEGGCFERKAVRRQRFGMRTPEEERTGAASVGAEVVDIDGDGIADLVLTKVSGGLTDLKTEIRLYPGEKGGGFASKPRQTFLDEGFGAFSRYVDVDGDGKLEMVQPRAEVSILGLTRVLLSSSVSLDVLIRRRSSSPERFFDPEPVQELTTTFGLDFSQPSGLLGSIPVFGEDFDGDGRPDALLSKGRDEMELHRGRPGRKPFEGDARYGLEGEGSSATLVLDPGSGARPELLVWYPRRRGKEDTMVVHRPTLPRPDGSRGSGGRP